MGATRKWKLAFFLDITAVKGVVSEVLGGKLVMPPVLVPKMWSAQNQVDPR